MAHGVPNTLKSLRLLGHFATAAATTSTFARRGRNAFLAFAANSVRVGLHSSLVLHPPQGERRAAVFTGHAHDLFLPLRIDCRRELPQNQPFLQREVTFEFRLLGALERV